MNRMLLSVVLLVLLIAGCSASDGGTTPPPTPGAPTIDSFTALPSTIDEGGSSTLEWSLSGEAATTVTIDNGVGEVTGSSSVEVSPTDTTTYTLTASNANGSDTETAQVTVSGTDPDPDPTPAPPGSVDAPTTLSGSLTQNSIMRSGKVYFIESDVTVPTNITLTIEPGAVIKFSTCYRGACNTANDRTFYADIIVEGAIVANGTAAQPIVFTGIRDDTVGGDTNSDGGSTAPEAESWGEILLKSGAVGTFANVEFRYGLVGITTQGADLTVDTIKVQDARTAILISPNDSPTVSDLSTTRVNFGGVTVTGGQMSQNAVWGRGDALFIVDADVYVASSATLTIQPGTVVKFSNCYRGACNTADDPTDYADLIVEGALNAEGTEENPITITSILDDTAGGDTNGDGSASVPSSGSWGEILIRNGASGTFANAEFRYAIRGIETREATLTANNIEVQNSRVAVLISPNDSPTVSNLETTRVDFGGVTVAGGQMSQNAAWGKGDAVFVVAADVYVAGNATLTIEPGTVVKFSNCYRGACNTADDPTDYADLIVYGRLVANGTPQPIVLTSILDDTVAGDTNGDGGASSPTDGVWGTVILEAGSTSDIDNVEVRYPAVAPNFP